MTENPNLTVGGLEVEPGEKKKGWLKLGTRPDGTPLGIPLVVINGAKPGPRLALIAGVHGDEYDCCEGLRRFLSDVDPSTLSGAIVATPQANPAAFESFSRHSPVDHLDLNRCFPGNPDGFLTERVADALVTHIMAGADYLLDMHSGGMTLGLMPFVGFDDSPGEIGEKSFKLAQSTGIETLYAAVPFKNVLRLVAAESGVPSILVEIGSEGRMREDLAEQARMTLAGVALRLGMVPESEKWTIPYTENHTIVRAAKTGEFLQAPTGGFLLHRVALGQTVEAGEVLGEIVDPFGEQLHEIRAPHGGLIGEMRTVPATRIGDWTHAVLPVAGRVPTGSDLQTLRTLP
ncbi:putative deacylase [Arthrobacter sp. 2762]